MCHDSGMTKSIPPELQALFDAFAGHDQFDGPEDPIKTIHTKLLDPETQEAVRNAQLIRQLEVADAEGGEHSMEEVFGEIRAELDDLKPTT